ncbi:MAG: transferase, partial [Candidatus Eisenbacteria bacterium]|nr:transferase [Candidatus Eisenbacteria bacterium]
NSDLKNNYGSVRVTIDGRAVDTESTFVGATIGDHTKTAIGTKLNTGTVIGVFCNVVSSGFPPKYIPSFSWCTPDGVVEHELEKALSTARLVMSRRDVEMSAAEEELIRSAHGETAGERRD